MVYAVVFDKQLELKEVRAYPTDHAKDVGSRHRIPYLLEPGSELFNRVLKRETERCRQLDTKFEVRDSYGVVEVK